ncbi:MAG TPA: phenylpyruvate tautomerase MIF-related protein [Polyangia bacterium]|jgi:phenylpyruvate tautomerase PptA (4-oxalocrotonate tautomerase family)|nr:phenylpyruvate tautomerase MIF-related protein [Polyangia bacterium]
MPLIQVFTSATSPAPPAEEALHEDLSRVLTEYLRKPKQWIMTSVLPGLSMTFGGSRAPACIASLKNVGSMSPEVTSGLSRELCAILSKALGVPTERIYIDFQDAAPSMWGWNGDTFG